MIPSASLVPENDPSVLFNTAGMQQFKRFYTKPEEAPASRIVTCQKCIRTGDIEEVGDDTHLTFFEMLGNFSFGYPEKEGSYFKEEAIKFAWEFLTEELKLDKSRIHATYFEGKEGISADEESLKILQEIEGLKEIKPQGFDDNFWSLGTEGSPGGPTVEFYVDGIEVWNLVFNEFVMEGGKYIPAKYKGVDTGMGLERLLTVINGKKSVYETDLFESIIKKIEELSSSSHPELDSGSSNQKSLRVIADHIKTATLAIGDGLLPSNKDAGYIVRRLIRRAVVKANQLGIEKDFIAELAETVFEIYNDVYFGSVIPDLIGNPEMTILDPRVKPEDDKGGVGEFIKNELNKEEDKFRKTLKEGLSKINSDKELTGKDLFDLYQSFGLPIEVSLEEAKNKGIKINNSAIEQFNNFVLGHQELSRTASAGMFKGGLADSGEEAIRYHTATHLLQQALRDVLGQSVQQKGSNINAERMRFDFTYAEKMTPEQLKQVEDIVNEKIEADLPVTMEEMNPEEAKESGAIGLFEHKYGDKVKVYTIGDPSTGSGQVFSREICGGPHVSHTGELGHFKILKEESSSAGVRRIKAVLE